MREMSEPLEITDRKAARAFASATSRSIVFALMDEEASLQALSQRLGLSLSLLHYHIGKLRRLGLVQLARLEGRMGRPVSIYRAAAQSFLVPAHLTDPSPSSGLKAELDASLQRHTARFPPAAIMYDLGNDRTSRMRRIRSEGRHEIGGEWWGRLELTQTQAALLIEEVQNVLSKYERKEHEQSQGFLFYFALSRTTQ